MSVCEINFHHDPDFHSIAGAEAVLGFLFEDWKPTSILDVGCGTGSWLVAAKNVGVEDLCGIDGIQADEAISYHGQFNFVQFDLRQPIDVSRRYDLVICLEVAEHLDEIYARVLVDSLVKHSDVCLFSAAAPGQGGTHHVNCQWPEYWQELFNERGFYCSDELRWKIWNDPRIEPWYRQNIFLAKKDEALATHDPRIKRVIHPEVLESYSHVFLPEHLKLVEAGSMPATWYLRTAIGAVFAKLLRWNARLRSKNGPRRGQ